MTRCETANLPDRRCEGKPTDGRARRSSPPIDFALKLGLFYAAYFFFGGVQLPFFPLWLEARGLDASTIGLVIAVPTLVRIVATPIITHQADRRRALKATLVIAAVVGRFAMIRSGLVERRHRHSRGVLRWRHGGAARRCCR